MRLLALLLATMALLVAALPATASAAGSGEESVVRVGEDVVVDGPVQRVVVVGGEARLTSRARVSGDVLVVVGTLRRDPGAVVGGSEYVLDRGAVSWIPGPAWLEVLLVLAVLLAYRAAVWWTVTAIARVMPGTGLYERTSGAWERRRVLALVAGAVLVCVALPLLGLLALTVVLLPVALLGLAVLLAAAGTGLAQLREGPNWPRRLPAPVLVAYVALPPALEVGLLLTAAAGLGSAAAAAGSRMRGA